MSPISSSALAGYFSMRVRFPEQKRIALPRMLEVLTKGAILAGSKVRLAYDEAQQKIVGILPSFDRYFTLFGYGGGGVKG